MLVTANILRNMLTITNNLLIPLIIGEVVVVADACFKVAFFNLCDFAFSNAIPHEKDCNQKNNLTNGSKYGAVNDAERRDKETCNN